MATLKISDLSVGDWVSFDTAYLTVEGDDIATAFVKKVQQPARIKSILGDQDLIFAEVEPEDDFCTIYLKIEHIRPIPITSEILERNGWRNIEKDVLGDEYEYDGEERVWDDGNCSLEICEEKQGVFWYSRGNEYYMWRLEYVHQLQHLIRLAGADREIVMPKK